MRWRCYSMPSKPGMRLKVSVIQIARQLTITFYLSYDSRTSSRLNFGPAGVRCSLPITSFSPMIAMMIVDDECYSGHRPSAVQAFGYHSYGMIRLIYYRGIHPVFILFIYIHKDLWLLVCHSREPRDRQRSNIDATTYGRGILPSLRPYWMVNFVGMATLGIASGDAAMVLGQQPWAALWLIFWVITAFYTLELAPPFYARGRAWALHHEQREASRAKDRNNYVRLVIRL
ncbi:hypothetical protein EV127DRAFT_247974 [Xylaria flabelliformis]|nr:hypothetical protein EV127DRAFT_247974 [Xylaria flabelliformis]